MRCTWISTFQFRILLVKWTFNFSDQPTRTSAIRFQLDSSKNKLIESTAFGFHPRRLLDSMWTFVIRVQGSNKQRLSDVSDCGRTLIDCRVVVGGLIALCPSVYFTVDLCLLYVTKTQDWATWIELVSSLQFHVLLLNNGIQVTSHERKKDSLLSQKRVLFRDVCILIMVDVIDIVIIIVQIVARKINVTAK